MCHGIQRVTHTYLFPYPLLLVRTAKYDRRNHGIYHWNVDHEKMFLGPKFLLANLFLFAYSDSSQ